MSIFQLLNGLTFAALLFVVASGFTLIFGLLRIVTLAHAALYLFVVLLAALWLLLKHARVGALIRAGVDDAEMVEASGVNIRRVFLVTFLLGSALAGLGGLMGGAFLSLYPSADAEILVFSLAVVIIGGADRHVRGWFWLLPSRPR